MTHALLAGSPAIDKGRNFGFATDQRGGPRIVDFLNIPNVLGWNGSDIGALEVDSLLRILATTRTNTVSRVKFKSDSGSTYTLERKNTLTNVPWTAVASALVGNGQPLELIDFGPLLSQCFYRIRAGPPTQLVYANNFEGTVGGEWSVPQAISTTPVGGRKFLGEFANTVATLQLPNLPSHTQLSIRFDLFILKSWDGNRTEFGPDMFQLSVRGGPTMIYSTFSTYTTQSYPGASTDSFAANTGAVEINSLGYTHSNLGPADAVYRLTVTLNHVASSVTLDFSGVNLQEIGDESWGLDNVRVEAITTP